jgi:hypothetical protein
MVDDKLRILAALKKAWGDRVTTVFPRHGKFANDPKLLAAFSDSADVSVARISDLLEYSLADLLKPTSQRNPMAMVAPRITISVMPHFASSKMKAAQKPHPGRAPCWAHLRHRQRAMPRSSSSATGLIAVQLPRRFRRTCSVF